MFTFLKFTLFVNSNFTRRHICTLDSIILQHSTQEIILNLEKTTKKTKSQNDGKNFKMAFIYLKLPIWCIITLPSNQFSISDLILALTYPYTENAHMFLLVACRFFFFYFPYKPPTGTQHR